MIALYFHTLSQERNQGRVAMGRGREYPLAPHSPGLLFSFFSRPPFPSRGVFLLHHRSCLFADPHEDPKKHILQTQSLASFSSTLFFPSMQSPLDCIKSLWFVFSGMESVIYLFLSSFLDFGNLPNKHHKNKCSFIYMYMKLAK